MPLMICHQAVQLRHEKGKNRVSVGLQAVDCLSKQAAKDGGIGGQKPKITLAPVANRTQAKLADSRPPVSVKFCSTDNNRLVYLL